MKLYTKATSDNSDKEATKGGNNYIETLYFATSRDQANYRTRFINDDKAGMIYLILESYHFGKWREIKNEVIYINVEK